MPAAPFDRRAFLQRAGLAGTAAVALAATGRRPWAHADETLAPFHHGVASGDPLADRVILWTRISDQAGPTMVGWNVWSDAELTNEVRSGQLTVDDTTDYCVKIDATGLAPSTYYYYRFTAPNGAQSLVGRTKTLPAADATVERFRAAVVSCSNYTGGFFNAYAHINELDDVDIVLHVGDYLYEYGNGGEGNGRYGPAELEGIRDHAPDYEYVTLEDYRIRHGHYKLDPDLRRLHQLHPFVTTWDDHETTDNSFTDGANNHNPDTEGDWYVRKAVAQQAYDEWMPIRGTDPNIIYRSFQVGTLLDLIYLDTRLEGRSEPLGDLITSPTLFEAGVNDPERTMMSPTQLGWFTNQLVASQTRGATWRVVGQQVMFMQFDGGQLVDTDGFESAGGQDAPSFGFNSEGNAINPDAWDGYNAERDRVYDVIDAEGITDLVVLTGDIHTSWAGDLPRNAGNPYDPVTNTGYDPATGTGSRGVEFVTPSVTSDNINEIIAEATGASPPPEGSSSGLEAAIMAENVHIKMVDLDRHGYMTLDITPTRVQSDWFHSVTRLEATTQMQPFRPLKDSWYVDVSTHRLLPATSRVEAAAVTAPQPPAAPSSVGGSGSAGGVFIVGDTPDPDADPDLASTGGGAAIASAAAIALAVTLRTRNRVERDEA
jgi:alkaline phosphatase D